MLESGDRHSFDPLALLGKSSELPYLPPPSVTFLSYAGVVFVAILLNGFLFGVLTQQFYSYWTSGFDDSRRIKAFVVTQYSLVALQYVMLYQLAWNIFVINGCLTSNAKSYTWQGPVSSMSQCVLILLANTFLALRIYDFTGSRLQSGSVMALSVTSFVFGLVTLIATWTSSVKSVFIYTHFTPAQQASSVVWHITQAICECLISTFLTRALLASRTGLRKSDNIVSHLTRHVVQIGLFATTWAIAELATWFLLPRYTVYALFDMTTGSIYTHMIYDTLLSRTRLRDRLAKSSHLDIAFPSIQSRSQVQVQVEVIEGQ
ncbi:hypothetical protein BJV74DRAFT_81576 [Russula compacta]|nr:hypothetical protein BJV74DRAFT_81576 [Russula compacta]